MLQIALPVGKVARSNGHALQEVPMKSLLALVFTVTTLSGCVVAPVAEPGIYVAPAPAAVYVRPVPRYYGYGYYGYRGHRRW